ncbi:MAG TPA: YihY family inner membrane protein [Paucimonas sp.]|nr:YihY family inner membrane protein [Paucimonas sp.]HJW54415.1 YihY family inner membrane protein [Burkholderiaceae bacterium]
MLESGFSSIASGLRGIRWSRARDLLRFAQRRLDEELLPQVAGSLTFTTVLALVPLLTIALAIFTTFPLFNTFRASLEAYFVQNLMPKTVANTILGYLNQFAAKATRLSAFGAVGLIITAVTTMGMIDRVFNHIWRVKTRRPLAQRVLVYWAIITLGPLLIGVSMRVTSYAFTATNGVVMQVPLVGAMFYTLVSVALTTGAFTLLYMAVPNRFVAARDAAWGGLVAAVAFEVTKRLFAVFVTKFPTYTIVYGALAAMPIFLVWIYVSWLITLVGAVIAAALPVVRYERWWHVVTPASAFVDAMAVLRVLHDARESGGSAVVDADMIRSKTRLGFDESETLLQKMLDAGWVGRIKTELPGRMQWGKHITSGMDAWVLTANPQQLTLADIYRLFMFDASANPTLARQVESAIEDGLNETLAAHVARSSRNTIATLDARG